MPMSGRFSLDSNVILYALHERYQFSFWDCLAIAAALSAECPILYTEDLQENQTLEGRLRVLNPFTSYGPLS